MATPPTVNPPAATHPRQALPLAELAALTEAGLAIVRAQLDLDGLCELVYHQVASLVDARGFHLGLFEGDSLKLKVWVHNGRRLPPTEFPGGYDLGIVGWVRSTRQPLVVHDFPAEMDQLPARPQYISEDPPRSALFLPLVAADKAVGSMSIQHPEANAYTAEDLQLLTIIASQAAAAIVNAQLFQAIGRRVEQLTAIAEVSRAIAAELNLDDLLTKVVELMRRRFGYYHVQIFLVEDEEHRAVFRASTGHDLNKLWKAQRRSQPFNEGIIGWVAAHGELLLANDVTQEPRYRPDDPRLLLNTRSELAVPITAEGKVLGVLDVQSRELHGFDADDIFILQALADQVAVAVDSAWSYRAQQEEAWMTSVLFQAAQVTARANSLPDLLAAVTHMVPASTGARGCGIWLQQEETACFELTGSDSLQVDDLAALRLCPDEPDSVLSHLLQTENHIELHQADHTLLPAALWRAMPGDQLLLLPLTAQNRVIGCLIVGLDSDDVPVRLHEKRVSLLAGIAQQLSLNLENIRLLAQEAQRIRLSEELQVAQRIQASLLPQQLPSAPGYELAHVWEPAREVGGDFYDFIALPEGKLGVVMADVADKGIPAALFMATTSTLLRMAAQDHAAPDQVLLAANTGINANNREELFVTAWYGVLNPATHRLVCANAGHSLALHVRARDGSIRRLRPAGMPLGVVDDPGLRRETVRLAVGDLLVLYTDGLTDALDEAGEEFGQARLETLLRHQRGQSATEVATAIHQAVLNHIGHTALFDDVTLAVVKRSASG